MFCIHCHRIDDFHETYTCRACRVANLRVDRNILIKSLLLEAYGYVTDVELRERIERVIPIKEIA